VAYGHPWTAHEDEILRREYHGAPRSTLIRILTGRTWLAIKIRSRKLRLFRKSLWSEGEDEYIREHYLTTLNSEMLERLPGRTLVAIQSRARFLGRHRMRKASRDEWSKPHLKFWRKVEVQLGGCWEWRGPRDKGGYGRFYVRDGKKVSAHVFSYESIFGPVPDGLELDHLCRTRHCVHPLHVEPTTHRENCARGLPGGFAQLAAIRKLQTHCVRGHSLTKGNVTFYRGGRCCKECHRIRERERRLRAQRRSLACQS